MGRQTRIIGWVIKKDTPDDRGFINFAKEQYHKAYELAKEIVKELGLPDEYVYALFNKISSPLVYLHERWEALPMETKMKYMPKEDQKYIKQEREKILKKLEEKGIFKETNHE